MLEIVGTDISRLTVKKEPSEIAYTNISKTCFLPTRYLHSLQWRHGEITQCRHCILQPSKNSAIFYCSIFSNIAQYLQATYLPSLAQAAK